MFCVRYQLLLFLILFSVWTSTTAHISLSYPQCQNTWNPMFAHYSPMSEGICSMVLQNPRETNVQFIQMRQDEKERVLQ